MKSPRREQVEREVHAMLAETMAAAEAEGLDPYRAAIAAYREVPEMVVLDAWVKFDGAKLDQWWDQLERTIDGEVLRNAVATTGGGPKRAAPRKPALPPLKADKDTIPY